MSLGLLRAQNSPNGSNDAATAQGEPSTTFTNIQSSGVRVALPGGFAVETSTARTNTLSISNSIPAAGAKHNQSSDDGAVSIDNTGIHVAGGNGSPPVDIHWKNSHASRLGVVALAATISPFIFTFSITVAILIIIFYSRHRHNKLMHETIRAMIDKGMPVTPEVIAGLNTRGQRADVQGRLDNRRSRNRQLLPALILIGVGLAMTGFHPWHAGTGGKIVLFIGLAFFIVWLVERKQNGNDDRNMNAERKQDNDQQPPKI